MLNIGSGELSQASLHLTAPGQFFSPINGTNALNTKSRNEGVFKNRMLSVAAEPLRQLDILDQD